MVVILADVKEHYEAPCHKKKSSHILSTYDSGIDFIYPALADSDGNGDQLQFYRLERS